jgi:hypothetical protein
LSDRTVRTSASQSDATARTFSTPPLMLQRLIPIDEGCANPLKGGGTRHGLPLVLQELVAQGLRPV